VGWRGVSKTPTRGVPPAAVTTLHRARRIGERAALLTMTGRRVGGAQPLFDATHAKQQQLKTMYQRLLPSARALFRAAGLPGEPSLVDLVWAYSVYWSRALQLPDREAQVRHEGGTLRTCCTPHPADTRQKALGG
jgi:hypothetical protein